MSVKLLCVFFCHLTNLVTDPMSAYLHLFRVCYTFQASIRSWLRKRCPSASRQVKSFTPLFFKTLNLQTLPPPLILLFCCSHPLTIRIVSSLPFFYTTLVNGYGFPAFWHGMKIDQSGRPSFRDIHCLSATANLTPSRTPRGNADL